MLLRRHRRRRLHRSGFLAFLRIRGRRTGTRSQREQQGHDDDPHLFSLIRTHPALVAVVQAGSLRPDVFERVDGSGTADSIASPTAYTNEDGSPSPASSRSSPAPPVRRFPATSGLTGLTRDGAPAPARFLPPSEPAGRLPATPRRQKSRS